MSFCDFAVHHFAQALDQQAVGVAFEQGIPVASPENFDAVPAGAAERGFQFLNDFSVAANRAVQALQIAIDDENKIVEIFARSERDRAQSLGLIRLAVSEERPDFCVGDGFEAAIFEIAIEAGLVDRHERAQAHRNRGIFPEVRHQPGVRIGRQAAAFPEFAAEILQLLCGKAAFEKRAGIDAGRSMPLQINRVAFELFGAPAKEMVEADFKQRGRGGICGNVPADAVVHAVGANHHGQSVPADQALDPALDFLIAGKYGLLFEGNGIDVRSVRGEGVSNSQSGAREREAGRAEGSRRFPAFLLQNCIEGLDPFLHFLGIDAKYLYVGFVLHGFLPLRLNWRSGPIFYA